MATLANLQFPILPKHIWQDITFADASVNGLTPEQAIGTGPFQIESFDPQQVVVLNANKGFWAGPPHVDQLIYQVFGNDEAKINALINGDVDFLDEFPTTLVDPLRNAPGVTVNTAKANDFVELGFNSWDPTPERFTAEGCRRLRQGPHHRFPGQPVADQAGGPRGDRGAHRQEGAHRPGGRRLRRARPVHRVAAHANVRLCATRR